MRARQAVGKRIVRLVQQRVSNGQGMVYTNFEYMELEDGTRIVATVVETNAGEYGIELAAFNSRKWRASQEGGGGG